MKIFFNAFRHCLDFKGKTNREEFLIYWAILSIIILPAYFIDHHFLLAAIWSVSAAVSIIIVLPTFAITVRRLHDTGKRGWWAFIQLFVAIVFAPFLLSNPNSVLLAPFIIIEGLLSLLMLYLLLQPSKETPEE